MIAKTGRQIARAFALAIDEAILSEVRTFPDEARKKYLARGNRTGYRNPETIRLIHQEANHDQRGS